MGIISEIFNFDNIGGKIKNLAKWSCWITILLIWIAASISFIDLVSEDCAELCWIPLVAAIVGPIFVWLGSWVMYAFGEFVEDIHAIRNKDGTEAEVKLKREAEEKLRQEAAEKAKREKEEEIIYKYIAEDKAKQQESKARKQAAGEKARKIALKISPTGTGYICPVCKTTNASFSPCVKCQYDPQIVININEGLSDKDYIDVTCPACKETLSFLPNEKNTVCPYCGKQIVLK